MTDDVEVVEQEKAEQTAMEAAFAEASESKPEPSKGQVIVESAPEPAKADAELREEEKPEHKEEKPTEATPPAPPANGLSEDQAKLLSAIPKLEQLLQRVDKVDGNYGEIKRLLEETKKASATPKGAAEFTESDDGDYLDQEFPDLAPAVQAKIDKSLAKVTAGMTPEQLEHWYQDRKASEHQDSLLILEEVHPDRIAVRESPEWKSWFDGLPVYEQMQLNNSEDPYYVIGMISKFKDHRDTKTSLQEKSKKRIENAVTPRGVQPTGHSTITEEEAAEKAFEAQFE